MSKEAIENTPEGWTLQTVSFYTSSKPGSKPEIHFYLEKPLGKGEVRINKSGIEFSNCTQVEEKTFKFQTNKYHLDKLVEYVKNKYNR